MDFYTLSDKGIAEVLGERIRALRLRKNTTQKELAQTTMLSLNVIKALESGRGKLSTLIAVLRELGALDELDSFIPDTSVSPLQLARLKGRVRQRASGERGKGERGKGEAKDAPEW
jgi:transcriptional regulator with XRE-family HTH domain